LEVARGTTCRQLAERLGANLSAKAIAAKVDGRVVDLEAPLTADCQVRLLLPCADDPDALEVIRHSAAHVMAEAICSLWPEAKLVYGPPVDNGFYYDIDLDRPITPDDFAAIEQRMAEIVAADKPFRRYEMPRDEAMRKLRAEGNPYKIDNAERAEGDSLSFYVTGTEPGRDFEDLCRGPHVPSTGRIGAFKVLQVSGAYYRGDASQKMLQRVYGTAWPSKKDLKRYLQQLEEARKRDHRVIGKQLELFLVTPDVGAGLVLWMPKGAMIRHELEQFLRAELVKQGYEPVYTPHIGRLELYRQSGHYPYYSESMYPPVDLEGEQYLLKPMNCPHHIQIYKAVHRSYRDLPVRLAEFGTVYRYEQSGELSGMTRVRGFTQDDAHIFCTPEQLPAEIASTVELTRFVLSSLGLTDYRVRIGLRDRNSDKYVGGEEVWRLAERVLLEVAESMGLDFSAEEGEAAFYGPKIDFVVKDCIGREWQLGTVQVDYNLPERFGLEYIGSDNKPHRPVMIHRAPFGSLERFVGLLIEHYAGAFPLWLAPEQVRVATISEKADRYARTVYDRLCEAGMRARLDCSAEKIGAKIRQATLQKVPYILVVGEKEAASQTVNVRHRSEGQLGAMSMEQFVQRCQAEIQRRGGV